MSTADLQGFDEDWYLRQYEDVARAVARGEWVSGYAHYCAIGRSKGRRCSAEVDEAWYLKTYPLAHREIEAGYASDVNDHYLRFGRHRGYLSYKSAYRSPNPATFRSRFGGLWIDQSNALDLVGGRLDLGLITEGQAELLIKWFEDGYVILDKAIPDETLDRALSDLIKAYNGELSPAKFQVHGVGQNLSWVPEVLTNPAKALDLHWFSPAIRDAIFSEKVIEFLHLIFERRVLASQTLSFWRGSGQDGHQDSAYVNYSLPMQFAASWIALEDVREGAGELFYHLGGHRMPEFVHHGGNKGIEEVHRLNPEINDLKGPDSDHLKSIVNNAKGMSLKTERLLARQGDVLLWSADLPHGGSPMSRQDTRKSIVTHYCPSEVCPSYFERTGNGTMLKHGSRSFYSSGHYR